MKVHPATSATTIATAVLAALAANQGQFLSTIDVPELIAALSCNDGQQPTAIPKPSVACVAEPQTWFTVKQHAKVEPAFSESALRNLVFKASHRFSTKGEIPGNGLIEAGAIQRIGGKVLLHRARFLAWIEQQGSKARGGQS
jgi:hypothetical protein